VAALPATGWSDRGDGTAINREHCAGDEGRGRGEQERGSSPELLGFAVPAQRDARGLAGTFLIRIAAEGIEFTDPVGGDPDGSSPLMRIPAGPSSPASVFMTTARPGNSPLEMASSASGTRTDEASAKTMEPPVPVLGPGHGTALACAVQMCREHSRQPDGTDAAHEGSGASSRTAS
jgi:hypothetical protein